MKLNRAIMLLGFVLALPCEALFTFGLWFAPGWAKWPIPVDWSIIWFTGLLFMLLVMVATLSAAIVTAVLLWKNW